ncbi:uroporphyrinogen decarboxylase [Gammaproteobacteria bacterium]|nr:uroporphyrinogen decarboxylase [Gammaproteobacteria bacterium]
MNNSTFLQALRREQNKVPPIWFMRQAGRYLPEYKKIRNGYKNFLDMCKEPRTCAELALQPIERFNLDASILFSDILTIPDAFDLGLAFHEGEGPKFSNPISNPQDISEMQGFDIEKLDYVYKAVEETKKILPANLPLIGFCGSPWTLAAYSIEGGGSKDFAKTKQFISEHPEATKDYLEIMTDACFQYLKQQVLSGVNALQIFDSWADLLNPNDLETYSLEFTRKLVKKLKEDVVTTNTPIILFEKAPQKDITDILFDGLSCISLHWSDSIQNVSLNLKGQFAIQGNLNPSFLLESDKIIQVETQKICNAMKNFPGFIFNLGHGITPDIKPEKVQVMIDAVRN